MSKLDIPCIPDALSAIQVFSEATWIPQQNTPLSMSSERKGVKNEKKKKKKMLCSTENEAHICICPEMEILSEGKNLS